MALTKESKEKWMSEFIDHMQHVARDYNPTLGEVKAMFFSMIAIIVEALEEKENGNL